jgi:hypothetical protein
MPTFNLKKRANFFQLYIAEQFYVNGIYYSLAVIGMTLLICSDMPTFAVVLNMKQLSWHAAVKQVLPYSDIWHVAVNSYIKHSMHCIGVHDVAMYDVACMTWLA